MNYAITFLPGNWIEALGWTILHSLWQGALIGGIAWIALRALRNFDARTRYRVAFAALLLIPVLAVGTFVKVYEPQQITSAPAATQAYYYISNAGITTDTPTAAEGFHWISLLPYVVLLWIAGAAFFALRFIGGLVFLQRLRYSEQRGLPWHVSAQLGEWKRKLGISRTVRIAESALARTPMLVGYFKPIILLPLGCAAGLPKEQLEALMAHELAHVVRHDFIFNLVQELLRIVFFYHPGVWWLNTVIRDERESCCDEIAFGLGIEKISLAKALAALEEQKLQQPELALAAMGRGNLMQRIRRMFRQAPQPSMRERVGASALLLIGLLVISTSVTIAQSIKAKKEGDKKESAAGTDIDDNGDTIKDKKKVTPPPVPPAPPAPPAAPHGAPPVPPTPPTAPMPPMPKMPGMTFTPFPSSGAPFVFSYGSGASCGSGSAFAPKAYAYITGDTTTAKHIRIQRDKKGRVTEVWIDEKKVDPNSPEGKKAAEWDSEGKYAADWEEYGKQWEEYGKQWEEWSKQFEDKDKELQKLNEGLSKMPGCSAITLPPLPGMTYSHCAPGAFAYGYSYSDDGETSNPKIDSLRRVLDAEIAKENARQQAKEDADFKKQEEDFRKQDEDFRKQEDDFRKQEEDFRKQNAEFEKQQAEYEKTSNRTMKAIKDELVQDKLISDPKNYSFTVSKTELKVNGKTQSEELHQKYLNLVKKLTGSDFEEKNSSYSISVSND